MIKQIQSVLVRMDINENMNDYTYLHLGTIWSKGTAILLLLYISVTVGSSVLGKPIP